MSGVAAIVVNGFWLLTSIGGTGLAFSGCGTSSTACTAGVFGLLAAASSAAGLAFAIWALTRNGWDRRRVIGAAWVMFGVAFALFSVHALLGSSSVPV